MPQVKQTGPIDKGYLRHAEGTMKKIFITVNGGVAEVCQDTVPEGFEVEIIDFDNLAVDDGMWISPEAKAYITSQGWEV